MYQNTALLLTIRAPVSLAIVPTSEGGCEDKGVNKGIDEERAVNLKNKGQDLS